MFKIRISIKDGRALSSILVISEVLRTTMSIYIVFALLFAAVAANPLLQSENDGEEFLPAEIKQENWQLIPDNNGKMRLVDINDEINMEAEPSFNAPTDVRFNLFTRQNPTVPQLIQLRNNAQLAASNFVAGRQTRFHTHGWGAASHNAGSQIRNAWLQAMDCNVLIVDWSAGSDTANYILARNRVNEVGAAVADYIDWLVSQGSSYNNVVVSGHSLGAHVAGATGKRTNQPIQAVVGLCPAGPLFSVDDPANRIHHTDAQYVEQITTNAGQLGHDQPFGVANFFANWGVTQPGCGSEIGCSHGRVLDLYASSIINTFPATRCASLQNIRDNNCPPAGQAGRMGGEPINNSGAMPAGTVFFFATTATFPFV
ncbi:hypothetical protein HA402_012692 [Bradysia odoriphaga]|nr:hypothetical protein HA402_012692 [Bradysia odoriphaga]